MTIVIQDNLTQKFDMFKQLDGIPIPRVGEYISLGYVPAPKVARIQWLYARHIDNIPLDEKIKQQVKQDKVVVFIEVE